MQVPTHYLNNIVGLAEAHGASREQLLRETGVRQEELDDPEAFIEFEQFRQLIGGALEKSGLPSLGIRLGSQLRLTTHGILGYAAMSSETLAEALSLLTRFAQTRIPAIVVSLSVEKRTASLRVEEAAILGEIRPAVLELFMSAVDAAARFLVGDEFRCKKLAFPYAEPRYVDEYERLFDCPLVFDAEVTELQFDSRLLKMRLPLADEAAKRQAARRCEEELAAIAGRDDLEQRIRAQLLKRGGAAPSLDEMSRTLALSPRTLRRRLRSAGTSYKTIVDSVRLDLAAQYLRQASLTVYEIADRLGYRDPSNFGRAFKSWTGLSPKEFRESG